MRDPLADLVAWVTEIVRSLGYPGVAALIAVENLFPPLPLELILPLAGQVAGQGQLSLLGVVAAATAGSVAGALALYVLAAQFGEARLRRLLGRFGRLLLVEEADLDQARSWFDRHGRKAVLIGRLVPVVRGLISIPAGLARMPLRQFVTYTALGSGLYNVLLVSLGWALGTQWELIHRYARLVEYAALVAMAAGALWFVWRRRAGR